MSILTQIFQADWDHHLVIRFTLPESLIAKQLFKKTTNWKTIPASLEATFSGLARVAMFKGINSIHCMFFW